MILNCNKVLPVNITSATKSVPIEQTHSIVSSSYQVPVFGQEVTQDGEVDVE